MNKQIRFFICGPHCSGKTSILKDLYREGVITERGSEIGKDLFYQRNIDTASQSEKFEIEITKMEMKRDIEYSDKEGIIGIESWHPGNLAYAMIRNPLIVSKLLRIVKKSPLLSYAYGIHLRVSWKNIFARTCTFRDNREWAADFYTQIDNCLEEALKTLNMTKKCFVIDANRPYNEVYLDVKFAIERMCNCLDVGR